MQQFLYYVHIASNQHSGSSEKYNQEYRHGLHQGPHLRQKQKSKKKGLLQYFDSIQNQLSP